MRNCVYMSALFSMLSRLHVYLDYMYRTFIGCRAPGGTPRIAWTQGYPPPGQCNIWTLCGSRYSVYCLYTVLQGGLRLKTTCIASASLSPLVYALIRILILACHCYYYGGQLTMTWCMLRSSIMQSSQYIRSLCLQGCWVFPWAFILSHGRYCDSYAVIVLKPWLFWNFQAIM